MLFRSCDKSAILEPRNGAVHQMFECAGQCEGEQRNAVGDLGSSDIGDQTAEPGGCSDVVKRNRDPRSSQRTVQLCKLFSGGASFRCDQNLEIDQHCDTVGIAAFFGEPVMGAGGVIPPAKGYFQAILPILRKHDIPMISDEVICGFGRTGQTWGCQTYDYMPDAIISSKNLTAGFFPMGAVILGGDLARRVEAAVEAIEEFPHGFTASGHPVGCAIALKAIDVVMNEGLADNVNRLAPRFEAGLKRLAQKPNIGEYRGVGFMWALEAVRDKATKTPFEGTLSVSERIANACTDMGLICRPLGQSVVLCPPFILTEGQMDEMFEKLETALDKVFAEVA